MTAAPAFNVDTLLFVEPGKGGLRKRLNRHIFCYSMQQLGDDDLLFSTRPFNAAGTRVLQDAVALTPTAAVLPTLSLGRLTVAAQPEQIVLDMIRSFAVEFFVDVVARLCSDGVVVRTTALLDAPLLRRGRARAPRRLEHVASRAPHLIFAAFQSADAVEVFAVTLLIGSATARRRCSSPNAPSTSATGNATTSPCPRSPLAAQHNHDTPTHLDAATDTKPSLHHDGLGATPFQREPFQTNNSIVVSLVLFHLIQRSVIQTMHTTSSYSYHKP